MYDDVLLPVAMGEIEENPAVDEAAERARSCDVTVETHVGHGSPHTVITEYAADHADVIVMATHGREGLDHTLLGSVTEKVVRTAEVPVLTVPLS